MENLNTSSKCSFRDHLKKEFSINIENLQKNIDPNNSLKIDLHCHDKNSDVPDELWGRILGIPETWLKTSTLIEVLQRNGATALTITNHNNATSCWKLKEKGLDILVGGEFTCFFKKYNAYIHVLAYGFTPEQEAKLNFFRKDIYHFCEYCLVENIPTVLPHPTYLYFKNERVSIEILEHLALLFQRFEVLNGQRDIWQNLLTLTWLQGLDEEKISHLELKHGLQSRDFCKDPFRKIYTGGSDDHMGIFAGSCGTLVQIEHLKERRLKEPMSELILEGLRNGKVAPYGYLGDVNEKLTVAFLDYFCQVAMNMEDPGLTRILLHKGDTRDKLFCLGIANGIFELRRHTHTMGFLKTLHKAIRGKRPNIFKKLFISKTYRPIFEKAIEVSNSVSRGPEAHILALRGFIDNIYQQLNGIIVTRLQDKFNSKNATLSLLHADWEDLLHRLEMPVYIRALVGGNDLGGGKMNPLSLGKIFDQLSFPLLASSVLAASTYTSTRVMFNSRYLLNDLADHINAHQHPKRILWLTDTLYDKNGVSMFLQELLTFVQKNDLPIDFLVCGKIPKQENHLHVVEQIIEFISPSYSEQPLKIPNLMDIQRIFYDGAYDRVVCSTEGIGWLGLYLKTAFAVPAYFYMHTDWMDFFKRSAHMEDASLSQIRRYLRFFYQQFDGVFVLNEDHRAWLMSQDIGITKDKIHKTAHWPAEVFRSQLQPKSNLHEIPHLLYVGRLSEEKGVNDLALIVNELNLRGMVHQLTIVGEGPAKTALRQNHPHANFVGWKSQEDLISYYQNSDLLLLPSRFDTFGCVVIEAMNCGCPVVAYNCKGPKDIIEHAISGYLADSMPNMADLVIQHFKRNDNSEMSKMAQRRAAEYEPSKIIGKLLEDCGCTVPAISMIKPAHQLNSL